MWRELTSAASLLTMAVLLSGVGVFLWRINQIMKNAFGHREVYSRNLRLAGRVDEADRFDAKTRAISRRLPFYGKLLIMVGMILSVVGLTRSR